MHKGIIIVPYRDRLTHLNCFIAYMSRWYPSIPLAIVEQRDSAPWNKGLLFNAAYQQLMHEYDYMILHDVDFIPAAGVDYSYTPQPTLLATECSQFNYTHCYPTFFGGVVGISREHYQQINGFSNKFRGWGGEDDDLRRRCIAAGLQPAVRMGNRFENFIHPRLDVLGKDRNNTDYNHNLTVLQEPIDTNDGLSSAEYKVMSKLHYKECIHIRIITE